MPPSLTDLQAQLAIDKSVLDDEVIRQPVLFYTISEMLTEAIAERDAAKEELGMMDADLDNEGRRLLTKTGEKVARTTEAMFKNYVQTHRDHEIAFKTWLTAKTKADKLLALKEAFQQRSYMLRDLVSLYSANYYEDASIKPTKAQEASQYAANRSRMSIARAARDK
jgi:hypothetical protein